jgi:hypothetical protein
MSDDTQPTPQIAIVSLICGVLSVVCQVLGCCGVPMVGMIGIPLAIVAIVTGGMAMQQEGVDKTIPGVGVGAGCVTLLLQVLILGCAFTAVGAYIALIFAAILADAASH